MRLIKLFLISLIISLASSVQAQSYDADAQKFIDSAGITNTTQKNAVNQLVLRLKNTGIWAKMKAIYPLVGGSATAHKYNLKDPRDSDAAYRLTFSGGLIHNTSGIVPNGSTGYANTHLKPNSLGLNSIALSFYSKTNNSSGGKDIGAIYNSYCYLEIRQGDNSVFGLNSGNVSMSDGLSTDSRGLFTVSRTSSSLTTLYRNGTSIATTNSPSLEADAINIFLFANNNGSTAANYSNRECAFASISEGLSDSNATSLSHIVDTFLINLANTDTINIEPLTGDTTWTRSGNNIFYNNGNVGIGTLNPQSKLAVNGYITAKKLTITESGWADYVFDKDYKLATLEEIEKFIKLNQHLPGIPSAKEVEKNGINVGDNQALLLMKIEELTLLLIKQNKKLEKQNDKIRELEKRVKNIK